MSKQITISFNNNGVCVFDRKPTPAEQVAIARAFGWIKETDGSMPFSKAADDGVIVFYTGLIEHKKDGSIVTLDEFDNIPSKSMPKVEE